MWFKTFKTFKPFKPFNYLNDLNELNEDVVVELKAGDIIREIKRAAIRKCRRSS